MESRVLYSLIGKGLNWKKVLKGFEKETEEVLEKYDIKTTDKRMLYIRRVLLELNLLDWELESDDEKILKLREKYEGLSSGDFRRLLERKSYLKSLVGNMKNDKKKKAISITEILIFKDYIIIDEIFKGNEDKFKIIEKIKKALIDFKVERIVYADENREDIKIEAFLEGVDKKTRIGKIDIELAKEYGERVSSFLESIFEEKEENKEESGGIEDELFSLFNSIENYEEKVEEKEEPIEKEVKVSYKEPLDKEKEELEKLAKKLNYKLCKESDVIVSKEKYESLTESKEEEGIKVLKELAKLNNGASLSELYNIYEDINNVSIGNIEATLTSFFTNLSLLGFEPIKEGKIGDSIKVNKNEILKRYIFEERVKDLNNAEGKIKYYGWKYKEKRVLATILGNK
ncbi:MAG: hypothetical protein ACRC30_05380 [Clostridium sp.]